MHVQLACTSDIEARSVLQILEGLDHVHRRNYVHGDIKPENILVRYDARGAPRLLLGDLGCAVHVNGPPGMP